MNRVALPLTLSVAVVFLPGFGSSSASARPNNIGATVASATFTDAAGDSNGAPDITTVAVNDDPATGMVTIAVAASGIKAYTRVNVLLDSDKNRSTGQSGTDYVIRYWTNPRSWGWRIDRWNGSDWSQVPQSNSISFSYSGGIFTWQFSNQDLGATTGFAFKVNTTLLDTAGKNTIARDTAPDSDAGPWVYDLGIGRSSITTTQPTTTQPRKTTQPTTTTRKAVVRPLIGKPTVVPTKAVAGKRMTIRFPVSRSDNQRPLLNGTAICKPYVEGKTIGNAQQFKNGVATVTFTIPTSAKGKLLKIRAKIRLGTQMTTRLVVVRVS